MKKLLFIALAMVLALSVGLVGCGGGGGGGGGGAAVWNTTIPLTMHCTINQFASVVQEVYKPWLDAVHALVGPDGGKFNITVTYGDAPFDAGASLVALTGRIVDIAQVSPDTFYLAGIGYMPFLSPSMQATAYATYKLWTEDSGKWDKNGQLDGVKVLITSPLWGAQYWGHSVNVTQLSGFAGLPIRAEGAEATTIMALNATPYYLGTSDLGTALETHLVEGCFYTYTGWKGFSGVGPNTNYTTELNMFYRPYMLAMNLASYNALPAAAKTALDSVCGWNASVQYAAAHKAVEAADRALTESNGDGTGRPIYVPTTGEMDEIEAACANVSADWEFYLVDTLGFDAGIVARYQALIAEYLAL